MSALIDIWSKVTSIQNNESSYFEIAKAVYQHQYKHNLLFSQYIDLLGKTPSVIKDISDFAFLPIEYFKTHELKTGDWTASKIYESSATTGSIPSKHFIRDELLYLEQASNNFESHFGNIENLTIIGLLPSYLERQNSSLVAMVNAFVAKSNQVDSGFYLDNYSELAGRLQDLNRKKKKTVVIGVSFALLDLAEQYPGDYETIIFMETGGMKGRRKEIIRTELHESLKTAFNVTQIYSEYGMTELLSQAYLVDDLFLPADTMRVLISEINDPGRMLVQESGRINVIDLMNIDSCAFLQTSDLGKVYPDGRFEVLGRLDQSDLRGCNLMVL